MKIIIQHHDQEYTCTLEDDSTVSEAQEAFDRLLITSGYSNDIRCSDGGHYEIVYKEDNA